MEVEGNENGSGSFRSVREIPEVIRRVQDRGPFGHGQDLRERLRPQGGLQGRVRMLQACCRIRGSRGPDGAGPLLLLRLRYRDGQIQGVPADCQVIGDGQHGRHRASGDPLHDGGRRQAEHREGTRAPHQGRRYGQRPGHGGSGQHLLLRTRHRSRPGDGGLPPGIRREERQHTGHLPHQQHLRLRNGRRR